VGENEGGGILSGSSMLREWFTSLNERRSVVKSKKEAWGVGGLGGAFELRRRAEVRAGGGAKLRSFERKRPENSIGFL